MSEAKFRVEKTQRLGLVSAVLREEVPDYRSIAEPLLPVSEASVIQKQPGPAPSNLAIFSSNKVSMLGLTHHAASVGTVIIKPDCFSFMWWDGPEVCRINGEETRSTVLYAQGEQDGFYASGGARRTTGISVRRDDFVQTIAALRGIGPDDVRLNRTTLEFSRQAAMRFRADVDGLIKSAVEPGARLLDSSEALFALLVDAYLHATPESVRTDRTRPPEQIVRIAEERYFEAQGGPVSLADICAATGVSQSALYRAFHSICDDSPLAYFQKRKLTEARRALAASHAYRGAVKNAAISAGFTEMGRFSVEYRSMFGESPSATLGRYAGR